jgi:hypothetical protein
MPPDINTLTASSTVQPVSDTSSSGRICIYPVVGLGVVEINTVAIFRAVSVSSATDVRNPMHFIPGRGNSTSTTFWNCMESLPPANATMMRFVDP